MTDHDHYENEKDIDIEDIDSEKDDEQSSSQIYEIATYPADFTLEVLDQKWKAGDIEIPTFQRGFVWTQNQASKLIESFLVGLPVPPVFFYLEKSSKKYLVVDGQQRLRSILYFIEGYFGEEEKKGKRSVFRLKGLPDESKWKDQTYSDLSEEDERELKGAVLRAIIIKQIHPNDDTSIFQVFDRLNTGGTLLKNQEVRNCIYSGKFNDLLIELNDNTQWRKIVGKEIKDKHQRDVELILRFFALRSYEEYKKKPLKDFMSSYMKRHRNPTDEQIGEMREIFSKTIDATFSALNEKSFHIKSGLNSAAYDAVTVAFSKNLDKIPSDIKSRYQSLKQNTEFQKAISSSTTDVELLRKRFELTSKTLFS